MADLLKRGLEREGYAVDVANSGEQAVWAGTELPYDAVVLVDGPFGRTRHAVSFAVTR